METGAEDALRDLVAKRLRTGEIAVWDGERRSVTIVSHTDKGTIASTLPGSTIKALDEALGKIVVLV